MWALPDDSRGWRSFRVLQHIKKAQNNDRLYATLASYYVYITACDCCSKCPTWICLTWLYTCLFSVAIQSSVCVRIDVTTCHFVSYVVWIFIIYCVCVCVRMYSMCASVKRWNYIVGPAGRILTQSALIFSSRTLGNLLHLRNQVIA